MHSQPSGIELHGPFIIILHALHRDVVNLQRAGVKRVREFLDVVRVERVCVFYPAVRPPHLSHTDLEGTHASTGKPSPLVVCKSVVAVRR